MESLNHFLQKLLEKEAKSSEESKIQRGQELAGIQESNYLNRFAIQITVESDSRELLLEHDQYKQFKKSTDLYYYHPADPNIPVKAHYHIVANRSKKEIYAINMDGTAHHRANKGFEIPKKHAKELKSLGVTIPPNNILESQLLKAGDYFTFFIITDE